MNGGAITKYSYEICVSLSGHITITEQTFVATTIIGNPRLFDKIVSSSGNSTSSSSFDGAVLDECVPGLFSSFSSGSLYSLNWLTTIRKTSVCCPKVQRCQQEVMEMLTCDWSTEHAHRH